MKQASLGGIGPGSGAGVKKEVERRDLNLSINLARLRAAEEQLVKLGWKWNTSKGKWE